MLFYLILVVLQLHFRPFDEKYFTNQRENYNINLSKKFKIWTM